MRLARIDEAISVCESHLIDTGVDNPAIENLLTQSLLVIMYAEFEQAIKALTEEKCRSIIDSALKEFIGVCAKAVFRGVKSSDLSELLQRFGPTFSDTFRQKTERNQRAVSFYNNIVVKRHGVAHSAGSNVTFRELKQSYDEGHVVLDFFREALLVPS